MRIVNEIIALDALPDQSAADLAVLRTDILGGFGKIVWPAGSNKFSINPVKKANGVGPIKDEMMKHLKLNQWVGGVRIGEGSESGPVDAIKTVGNLRACFEWETGNIASSCRALLKIMDGLAFGIIDVGFIVVSSKDLARFLTDRIGQYEEFKWSLRMLPRLFKYGHIEIIVMEFDELDTRVPFIPKQACGNGVAAQKRQKEAEDSQQMNLFQAASIPESAGHHPPAS